MVVGAAVAAMAVERLLRLSPAPAHVRLAGGVQVVVAAERRAVLVVVAAAAAASWNPSPNL